MAGIIQTKAPPKGGRRPVQAEHMSTELICDPMTMALWRRRPTAMLRHSDQDSQYANKLYQLLLADHGIQCSMRRAGISGTTPRWGASSRV